LGVGPPGQKVRKTGLKRSPKVLPFLLERGDLVVPLKGDGDRAPAGRFFDLQAILHLRSLGDDLAGAPKAEHSALNASLPRCKKTGCQRVVHLSAEPQRT